MSEHIDENKEQMALTAIYHKFLKVARVNMETGRYEFLKNLDTEEERICLEEPYFDNYIKKQAETGLIHRDDAKELWFYGKVSDLQGKLSNVDYNITRRFRYRLGSVYQWVSMEIVVPQDYGKEDAWIYFTWKLADKETCAIEDSLYSLSEFFYRILKVNLTEDSYKEIKVFEPELEEGYVVPGNISTLLREFAEMGNVHPEDVEEYLRFANIVHLRNQFKSDKRHLRYRYRRKVGDKFQWVAMDFVPGEEYTEENQIVLMYIRDINDICEEEHQHQKLLEYYCYHDALTGLGNRTAYKQYYQEYEEGTSRTSVGVVFADANNLKQVNDKYGHKAGDEYLKYIADLLIRQFGVEHCYRISGDEFVVIMEGIEEEQFHKHLAVIERILETQEVPAISMGSCFGAAVESVESLMIEAETEMYKNKAEFYVKNPHVNRRRCRLEEMENAEKISPVVERIEQPGQRAADRIFEIFAGINDRDYMYMINLETGVTRWSQKAVDYWGLESEYIYDSRKVWKEIVHPDDFDAFCDDVDSKLAGSEEWQDIEYRLKNKNGQYVICTCRGAFFRGGGKEPDILAGMIRNHGIVDNIDPVTGLHNEESLTKQLQVAVKEKRTFSMLKIRIETFTNLKVLYGFSYGNRVLKKFAEELVSESDGKCRVYRLEGPNFVMFGNSIGKEELQELYEKIKKIAAEKIVVQSQVLPIRISGGALVHNSGRGTANYLKSCVTYALERSKLECNGGLVFYENEARVNDENTLKRIGAIHQSAINNGEGFYLCYQPIVNAKTGKIIGAEALLRWKKEPYGNVSPGVFIQWLEEEPYFYELGNWILKQALSDAKKIKEIIPDFIINVNISSTQLMQPEFRGAVLQALEETNYPPKDLCLELTERCRVLNLMFLHEEVLFFQSKDIKVALDDFGTGSASLNILLEVPVDEVKVDMTFVRGIQEKPLNQAVVGAIIQCTNQTGIMTCIEGVEDKELMEYLERYHATFYQGYYFAKPVTLEEFMKLVKEDKEYK